MLSANHTLKLILLTLLILLASNVLASENGDYGMPFTQVFTPEEYDLGTQNWDVVQNRSGLIFVANRSGLLEYDGVRWRKHIHPDQLPIISLAVDDNDRIYYGSSGDIGVLTVAENGKTEFTSLLDQLPDSLLGFGAVWTTRSTPRGIFFQSYRRLIQWQPENETGTEGKISVWKFEGGNNLTGISWIGNRLLLFQYRVGLLELIDDEPKLLPGGDSFSDFPFYSILPYGDDNLLLTSRTPHIYDGEKGYPFQSEMAKFADEYYGHRAIQLTDSTWALATLKQGVITFDNQGKILRNFTRKDGLPDNQALHWLFLDRQGGLWIPLNYGIARIEVVSPFRYFDEQHGLEGSVYTLKRFNGHLYAGTASGLFILETSKHYSEKSKFIPIEGVGNHCKDMLVADNRLLIAGHNGIFEIRDNPYKAKQISESPTWQLALSPDHKFLFSGHLRSPVQQFRLNRSSIEQVSVFEETSPYVESLLFGSEGDLWLGTRFGHVERVHLRPTVENGYLADSVSVYDSSRGIPANLASFPALYENHNDIFAGTEAGLFKYHREEDRFYPDDAIKNALAEDSLSISVPTTDPMGRLWFNVGNYRQPRGQYHHSGEFTIEYPLERLHAQSVFSFFFEQSGDVVWTCEPGTRISRFNEKDRLSEPLPVIRIRRITAGRDSIISNGYPEQNQQISKLPYELNSLRFEFALLNFNGSEENDYQYCLYSDGKAKSGWSEWSEETYRDISNLHEGDYKFEVRGRSGFSTISDIASYTFTIQPPWQRTIFAYIGYIALMSALIFLIIRWRLAAVTKRRMELEGIVTKRTNELQVAMQELEQRKEAEMEAHRLQTVNRLALTLAHEFNNPLAILKGIADLSKLDEVQQETKQRHIDKIPHIVDRLHNLVQKLLQLKELREIDYAAGLKILDLHNIPDFEDSEKKNPESDDETITS
ncbi:hypothetical protein K8I28_05035 [bacterium]|nr:hypothetical protein [bacterium]